MIHFWGSPSKWIQLAWWQRAWVFSPAARLSCLPYPCSLSREHKWWGKSSSDGAWDQIVPGPLKWGWEPLGNWDLGTSNKHPEITWQRPGFCLLSSKFSVCNKNGQVKSAVLWCESVRVLPGHQVIDVQATIFTFTEGGSYWSWGSRGPGNLHKMSDRTRVLVQNPPFAGLRTSPLFCRMSSHSLASVTWRVLKILMPGLSPWGDNVIG